jgi:hypothetical protein
MFVEQNNGENPTIVRKVGFIGMPSFVGLSPLGLSEQGRKRRVGFIGMHARFEWVLNGIARILRKPANLLRTLQNGVQARVN